MTNIVPIAIVGMGCRLPGNANSPEQLWAMLEAGRGGWGPVPSDRWNADAFYHPDSSAKESLNARSGYFLSQDVSAFDARFFSIPAREAKGMDPQQRLLLETTYEALENAGIPLEDLRGSDTAVFVAEFTRDYDRMAYKDLSQLHRLHVTGKGDAVLSNRISYLLDLRGPSLTIDTGCSGSLVALHQACQSIRSGETSLAVVGGAQLLLHPDQSMTMNPIGMTNPDGRCYVFDDRGSGYARGEGVATVVIKRLDHALRDGNPVHAVIAHSGVNQDGKTNGISLPNADAQAALAKSVYASAGLDPASTLYVEAHGTGTQAGDPAEMSSIYQVFCENIKRDRDLYVGSIKSNIGHLESASGLAALLKSIMVLKKGTIPPNIDLENPKPALKLDQRPIQIAIKPSPLAGPDHVGPRRISVNGFGYGGTNAHLVLEAGPKSPEHERFINGRANNDHGARGGTTNGAFQTHVAEDARRAYVLSAASESSLLESASNLKQWIQDKQPKSHQMQDLAYTLGTRRSFHTWRTVLIATDATELADQLCQIKPIKSKDHSLVQVTFVFTGQGAQWYAMGRELLATSSTYMRSIAKSTELLASWGFEWDLQNELLRDELSSQLSKSELAQPATTAIQIALVDLLSEMNIHPQRVCGHSSGEIGAAYASGALSHEAALRVSYLRGVCSSLAKQSNSCKGSMLAVGLGEDNILPQVKKVTSGRLLVACVNSPESTTISGDESAIDELAESLTKMGIFNRKLLVDTAYHSHHMMRVADDYLLSLKNVEHSATRPGVTFFSSVTGSVKVSDFNASYWTQNLVSPVQFDMALRAVAEDMDKMGQPSSAANVFIEIGPHSALLGPSRQILTKISGGSFAHSYISPLARRKDAVQTTLEALGHLFELGYQIDMRGALSLSHAARNPEVLSDLPSYAWDHSTTYWHESRLSRDHRLRRFPYHDLVGLLDVASDIYHPRWRYHIGTESLPWLRDHVVDGFIIFPGSGYLCMAIEAMDQLMQLRGSGTVKRFILRDVTFSKSIVVPEPAADGERQEVELQIALSPDSSTENKSRWEVFRITSYNVADRNWTEHCIGLVAAELDQPSDEVEDQSGGSSEALLNILEEVEAASAEQLDSQKLYDDLAASGNMFGSTFRDLVDVKIGRHQAHAKVIVPDVTSIMPGSYMQPHAIHPTTLDALNHLAAVLFKKQCRDSPVMPVFIEEISVSTAICSRPGAELLVASIMRPEGDRAATGDTFIFQNSEDNLRPVLTISGWQLLSIGETHASEEDVPFQRRMTYTLDWLIDVDHLTNQAFEQQIAEAGLFDCGTLNGSSASEVFRLNDKAAMIFLRDALAEVVASDEKPSAPHLEQFFSWIQRCCAQDTEVGLSLEGKEAVLKASYDTGVQGEMLERVGLNLADILTGKADALSIMLQDNLLPTFYAKALVVANYQQMAEYVKLLSLKNPKMNILEIGAGTGGATLPLLEALGNPVDGLVFNRFKYTDISAGFFEQARAKFSRWEQKIDFRTLDISKDPSEQQDFADAKFDLIIASNVLHATPSLEVTLTNVRKLLNTGGKLLLIEATRLAPWVNAIFGTLSGWWVSEDGRQDSPLLAVSEWNTLLQRCGFSGVDTATPDHVGETAITTMMVAEAVDEPRTNGNTSSVATLLLNSSLPSSQQLAENVRLYLSEQGVNCDVSTISDVEFHPGGTYIIFDIAEQALLRDPTPEDFEKIQALFTQSRNILWTSLQETDTVESSSVKAMINGMARVVRRENDGVRLITLDVRDVLSPDSCKRISSSIAKIAVANFFSHGDSASSEEREYAISNGQLLISRLRTDRKFNTWIESAQVNNATTDMAIYRDDQRPLKLEPETPGLLNSLRFVNDPRPMTPLAPDEIQLSAHAYGINFKDVFVALGQMPPTVVMVGETAGIVTAVGSEMQNMYKIGDRVIGFNAEPFASHARVKGLHAHVLHDGISFVEAASAMIVFYTSWYSLDRVARLQKGQSILIHAGSGGVGQSAIQFAQNVGAEIFITVGSSTKKQLIIDTYGIPGTHIFSTRTTTFKDSILRLTGGKGVDVVLNSLSGEQLAASWECLAPFGTFVEIGKSDIYKRTRLSMVPFDKCATFVSVDLTRLSRERPDLIHHGLKILLDLFEKGTFTPVSPVLTYAMTDIEDAFRLIAARKHTGKLVVVADEKTKVKAVLPPPRLLSLASRGTYVIVGGLGDLGQRICRFLASRGASHIVTLSRSLLPMKDLEIFRQEIGAIGGIAHTIQCDVTDEGSVCKAASYCLSNLPPVKGVIHGGMVLRDHPLEYMTFEEYTAAIRPKVHGTLNLNKAFASQDMEFFITLSSVTGILGMAAQSNYAAGNTFQDAFSVAQNSKPGNRTRYTTLDLGAIEGSNALNLLPVKGEELKRQGAILMTFDEVFKVLEYAMGPQAVTDNASQCVLGFDYQSLHGVAGGSSASSPLFSLVPSSGNSTVAVKGQPEEGQAADPGKLVQEAKTLQDAEAIIAAATAEKFAVFLDSNVRIDIPIIDLALDSLVSIELKNWMVRTFQAPLQASELAGALSITALAKLLASRSKCISDDIRGKPAEGDPENIASMGNPTPSPKPATVHERTNALGFEVAAGHDWACCKYSKILPRYPLVSLDEALDYFLENIGHFNTPEELEVLHNAVDELRQPDGPARKAHAKLVEMYNDPSLDSWMYDTITDAVYLKRPHPVAPYSNVMGTHFDTPVPHTQSERAAVITLAAFEFQKQVVASEVEPIWYHGTASCTWQWQWLFNARRDPGVDGDRMVMYPGRDYIAVLRRGHVFKVSLKDGDDDVSYESLQATFEAIVACVDDEGFWTGILTTDWRDSWAKFRAEALDINSGNVEYMKAIDEATFLVCLDDGSPTGKEDHVRQSYLGDGFNRWMDKCTQYIISENGRSSFVMEHGAIDGMTASRACEFVHDAIQAHVPTGNATTGTPSLPFEEFTFTSSQAIDAHIVLLRERYAAASASIGYKNHTVSAFGTDFLMACAVPVKSVLDATIQLAIRLHYGENKACWEGVSMAHYHKGRPEIMQVATRPVVDFCALATDESVPLAERRAALLRLGRAMSGNMQRTLAGRTHLRLFDLLKVSWPRDEPLPLMFQRDLFWRNPFVMAHHAPASNTVDDSVYGVQEPNSIWMMITPGNESIRIAIAGAAGEKTPAFARKLDEAAEIIKRIVQAK